MTKRRAARRVKDYDEEQDDTIFEQQMDVDTIFDQTGLSEEKPAVVDVPAVSDEEPPSTMSPEHSDDGEIKKNKKVKGTKKSQETPKSKDDTLKAKETKTANPFVDVFSNPSKPATKKKRTKDKASDEAETELNAEQNALNDEARKEEKKRNKEKRKERKKEKDATSNVWFPNLADVTKGSAKSEKEVKGEDKVTEQFVWADRDEPSQNTQKLSTCVEDQKSYNCHDVLKREEEHKAAQVDEKQKLEKQSSRLILKIPRMKKELSEEERVEKVEKQKKKDVLVIRVHLIMDVSTSMMFGVGYRKIMDNGKVLTKSPYEVACAAMKGVVDVGLSNSHRLRFTLWRGNYIFCRNVTSLTIFDKLAQTQQCKGMLRMSDHFRSMRRLRPSTQDRIFLFTDAAKFLTDHISCPPYKTRVIIITNDGRCCEQQAGILKELAYKSYKRNFELEQEQEKPMKCVSFEHLDLASKEIISENEASDKKIQQTPIEKTDESFSPPESPKRKNKVKTKTELEQDSTLVFSNHFFGDYLNLGKKLLSPVVQIAAYSLHLGKLGTRIKLRPCVASSVEPGAIQILGFTRGTHILNTEVLSRHRVGYYRKSNQRRPLVPRSIQVRRKVRDRSKKDTKPRFGKESKGFLTLLSHGLFTEGYFALCLMPDSTHAILSAEETEEDSQEYILILSKVPSWEKLRYAGLDWGGVESELWEEDEEGPSLRSEIIRQPHTSYHAQFRSWSITQGMANDIQKLTKLLKRLPSTIKPFYRECNQIREYAYVIGMPAILREFAENLRNDATMLGNTAKRHAEYVCRYFDEVVSLEQLREMPILRITS